MNLDLTDEETTTLERLLSDTQLRSRAGPLPWRKYPN